MLLKSTIREIKASFGRFITIFVIIALGVGFFSGLIVATPDMVETGDIYIKETNLFDLRLVSTLGYTEDDVNAAGSLAGVEYTQGEFSCDALFDFDGTHENVFCTRSITDKINKVKLTAGRMPEKDDECVADTSFFKESDIGKKIVLSAENNGDTKDNFKYKEYTVVGTVTSPLYLNFERGQASVGDGKADAFVMIPYGGFDTDYFTSVYLTFTDKAYLYTDEYDDIIDAHTDTVEIFAEERADMRYETVVTDAEAEIADGEAELDDARREYLNAVNELKNAGRELDDAALELADGWQKYEDGRRELAAGIVEANTKLAFAKRTLRDAQLELEDGEKEYADGARELEAARRQLSDASEQLTAAREQLAQAKAQTAQLIELRTLMNTIVGMTAQSGITDAAQLVMAIETVPGFAEQLDAALAAYGVPITAAQLAETWRTAEASLKANGYLREGETLDSASLSAAISKMQSEIDGAQTQIDSAQASLDEGRRKYNDGRRELEAARRTLDDGWQEYYNGLKEIEDAQDTLYSETLSALNELNDAHAELTDGEEEYRKGLAEYLDAKKNADIELADAAVKISDGERDLLDAKEKLSELKEPTVYVLDRFTNTGYACFKNDTSIVASIAKVFPLFFLLVAALVCITTMTRMVDENRGQIGTLKALGYGPGAVVQKFMIYSGSASVLGCVFGFLIGSYLFPKVIWTAYGIMYKFSPLVFMLDWKTGIISAVSYLICALGVTYMTCLGELRQTPAQIMRPKAPKNGKRIFLEYIKPLWKRLSFLQKVSLRNIFRYKKRLVMMLVGIAGSTALLLTGFGINDSIRDVVNYQYDEICLYDYDITFRDDMDDSKRAEFEELLNGKIGDITYLHNGSVEYSLEDGTKQSNLIVTDGESLDGFFNMYDNGKSVPYPGFNEAVINNGYAQAIGAEVGDTITLRDADMNELTVRVSGIITNYVYNYVFINVDTYIAQFGKVPEIKTAYIKTLDDTDPYEIGAVMAESDLVAAVQLSADMRSRVNNMMESLDYIVMLVLVCAGALAFTVIYNLTNINITERIREIATIKVLGFNKMETANYVFRENMMMTAMGSVLGLALGKLLHAYIMSQIKIEMMCFDIRIAPMSYLLSIVLSFVFAVIVAFFMFFKLQKINMAESLKSIE